MAWSVNKNNPTEAELARLNSSELEIYELENESQVGAGEVLWGEIKTRFLKQESDTNLESAVDNYEQVQARSILVYSSIETRQISDTEYEELPRISKSLWANFSFFSVIALVLMVSMFMVPMALSDRIEAEFSLMAIGMTVVVLLIASVSMIFTANKCIIKQDSQVATGKVVHFYRIVTSSGKSSRTNYYVAVAIEDGERYVRKCLITKKEWNSLRIGDPVFLLIHNNFVRAKLMH